MKKETKLLLGKAVDSLLLSIEHFNRPWDRGRCEAVLILLDHSFEMLLKAALLHRGAKIRERRAKQTIGFDSCVRKGLTEQHARFLTKEQALTLQAINSLRDAAQHHLLDISEDHLYMQAQAGLTLFRDVYLRVFQQDLKMCLPERVLPVSTSPPRDLVSLFDNETRAIRRLLRPGMRQRITAKAKLRALAILDGALVGERLQPAEGVLNKLCEALRSGTPWVQLFPGVASINLTARGTGPSLDLRISKKEGIPITLVKEGTPGAAVVAIKRVNELDFYNLGVAQLADHVGLSRPRAIAVVRYLQLQNDPECYKEVAIGSAKFKRYSQKAIERVKEAMKTVSMDKV